LKNIDNQNVYAKEIYQKRETRVVNFPSNQAISDGTVLSLCKLIRFSHMVKLWELIPSTLAIGKEATTKPKAASYGNRDSKCGLSRWK
jgi:hypothetical protein